MYGCINMRDIGMSLGYCFSLLNGVTYFFVSLRCGVC